MSRARLEFVHGEPVESWSKKSATPMRVAIVVDAACDLPDWCFKSPDLVVLPITVRIGGMNYFDMHLPKIREQFIRDGIGGKGADAETVPMSEREILALFRERLALDYDSVYCLTIASSRSPIYENATRASIDIAREARMLRQNAGITRPFQLRVIDTKNALAAQGISVLELMDLLKSGASQAQIRTRLFEVIDSTYSYLVPDDLYYLSARLRAKGDRSVGILGAMLGNALNVKPILRGRLGDTGPVAKIRGRDQALRRLFRFCARQVQRGLLSPHFSVSYGGPLGELRTAPGYIELALACSNEGVQLHESVMSITGMINVGQHAVAVGFAAPDHEPDI